MSEITLTVDGSSTVDASNLTSLNSALEALTQAHEAGDDVRVRSGSLRWRDGGVWISVTLELPTTPSTLDADTKVLAQLAVDIGLFDDLETATEEVEY